MGINFLVQNLFLYFVLTVVDFSELFLFLLSHYHFWLMCIIICQLVWLINIDYLIVFYRTLPVDNGFMRIYQLDLTQQQVLR